MAAGRKRKARIAQWLLGMSIFVLLAGAAGLIYWFYFQIKEVRVAVTNPKGEDAVILASINDWLVSQNRRYRLRIVSTGSPQASLDKLRAHDVEVAAVRADRVSGGGVASVMVLFNEVAGIVAHEDSAASEWGGLGRATIGVPRGTAPDDPLLLALLRLNGVTDPRIVSLETDQVRRAIERRQVQALGFVSPLPGYAAQNFSQYFGAKSGALAMPGVDDPEMLASKDRRYGAATIVAGSLRASPSVPQEAVGTLSVGRHLVVRTGMANILVAGFVRAMLDARRGLFDDNPLFRQAGSPDLEADAYLKVHDAAKTIYNGEEPSWRDLAVEWIYLLPVILGALGTAVVWLIQRTLQPEYRAAPDLVADLLDIRQEAIEATDEGALRMLRRRIDDLAVELTGDAYQYAGMDGMGAVLTAMLIAENAVFERRASLRDPDHEFRPEAGGAGVEKTAERVTAALAATRS